MAATPLSDELLQILVSDAEGWTVELGALNYFFSHVLERRKRAGQACAEILDVFFDLENHMSLLTQPFDSRFIDFMLRTVRDVSISLEDDLVSLQNNVGEYRYDRALHFGHNLTDLPL